MYAQFYDSTRKRKIKRIIDFDFLKESYNNGLLKNANIFARFLGIYNYNNNNDNNFKETEFKNNSDKFLDLGMTFHQWDNIILFLKYGSIKDEYLEKLMNATNILGGIPSFDKYYKERTQLIKKLENVLENYSPLKPEDDIKKKYQWSVIKPQQSIDEFIKLSELDYSFASKIIVRNCEYLVYRRLRY